MSDPEEPKQQPTPSKTPKRPQAPEREDSDQEAEDPGYQSGRSRSQSRRRRRQNQRQRAQQQQQQQDGSGGGRAQAQSMAKIEEEQSAPPEKVMQPFERIGPPSESMDGPVTYARALRGEIPMRGADPRGAQTGQNTQPDAKAGGKDIMDEEGLKLRLELNLDIEIELKASIHGDLTLALL